MRERLEPLVFGSQPGQTEPAPAPAVFADYWNGVNPDGAPVIFCPGDRVPEWLVITPEDVPEIVAPKRGNPAISQQQETA